MNVKFGQMVNALQKAGLISDEDLRRLEDEREREAAAKQAAQEVARTHGSEPVRLFGTQQEGSA